MKNKKIITKGDAVVYTGYSHRFYQNGILTFRIGRVLYRHDHLDDDALVDFGEGFKGHDGFGWTGQHLSPGKTAWWVRTDELQLVTLPDFPDAAPKRSKKGRVKVDKKAERPLSPQSSRVLDMLKAKGSITALEAAGVLRVRSLSRRIVDLKEAGHTIVRDLSKDTTGQRYARYYLKGEPAQAAA